MTEDLPYSPGLDARYSTALSRYVNEMEIGQSIFWRQDGWYLSGPGVEFVKEALGFIRPVRRRRNDDDD